MIYEKTENHEKGKYKVSVRQQQFIFNSIKY